jgi:hypothetical protein
MESDWPRPVYWLSQSGRDDGVVQGSAQAPCLGPRQVEWNSSPSQSGRQAPGDGHCRSYSPLLTRLSTVNPAFFASDTERGLSLEGELNWEINLRTARLQRGHRVSGGASMGRRRVNEPPQILQPAWSSQTSYS